MLRRPETSHRIHRIHRTFCLGRTSHGIHRIHRTFCLERTSHGIHRIHRTFCLERTSHGIHRIHRTFLLRGGSHRCHRFSQMLHPLKISVIGCCGGRIPPLRMGAQPNFCEICEFCGRSTQPNNLCSEICGRIFSAKTSVRSAYSVGDPLLRRRQDTSATMKICGRTHAVSVDSVGGHTITTRREGRYRIRVTALHHRCNVVTRSW